MGGRHQSEKWPAFIGIRSWAGGQPTAQSSARMQTSTDRSSAMSAVFKQEAHKLIDQLPDSAGWEDLAEQIEAMLDIEAGLADGAAGRVTDNGDVRREFGLA